MAQYLPKFYDDTVVTATAGTGGVVGGTLVAQSTTPNTVITPTAGSALCVGVASHDAAAGQTVSYYLLDEGVHRLIAGTGGVTAGDLLKADASGNVVTAVLGTDNPLTVVGRALTTATAGNVVEVQK